jgi:hypothetical protein
MKGESDEMSVPAAVEMIHATPPIRRSAFAREIWLRRRARGTDKTDVPFSNLCTKHRLSLSPPSASKSEVSPERTL